MTLNDYQNEALRTAARAGLSPELVLATRALGLAGEAGEVADLVKKHLGHGHDLPLDAMRKELGDVLWYIATLADALGFTLDEVAATNVAKLRARYPDGFDVERSKVRS